jgi:hypothetical protein
MNDFMLDENLIATLEQSLRQTRNAQNRLMVRLREVESESERLHQEIEALDNSASQTEAAIFSLLATMRSGNQTWNLPKNQKLNDDQELQQDYQRQIRQYSNNQNNQNNQNSQNNQNNPNNQNNQSNYYRNSPLSYINNSAKSVSSINQNVEPISNRFTDRTITQACSLLLRESGKPLHVNDLYNFLLAGGMEFKGNNPTISIAVSLNRNRRFRKVAPGTFDLVMRDASHAAS